MRNQRVTLGTTDDDLDRSASLRPLFTLLFWTHVGTGAVTRFVSCLSSRPPTYVARAGAWLSCPGPSTDPISGQGGGGSRPVVRSFGPQQALLEASRASGSHPRTHAFGSAPPLRKGCATGRAVRTALWDALWARPRRFTRPHSPSSRLGAPALAAVRAGSRARRDGARGHSQTRSQSALRATVAAVREREFTTLLSTGSLWVRPDHESLRLAATSLAEFTCSLA